MATNDVYITAMGVAMPNEPVSNAQMEPLLGQVGEKPSRVRRTVLRSNGIRQRYYAIEPATGEFNFTNAQLTAAAIRELNSDKFRITDISCLACGTSIADQLLPNHAVMTHGELGVPPCEVVATSGICLSGITAMKYAYMAVRSGLHSNAVATGSEIASQMMRAENFSADDELEADELRKNPELAFDKQFLRWMLSDGAGAALLQPEPSVTGLSLRIEWIDVLSYANEMDACMYAGAVQQDDGSLLGWTQMTQEERGRSSAMAVKQDVRLLNEYVIEYTVEKPLAEIAKKRELDPESIDYFLPHYSSDYFRDRVYAGMQKIGFDIPQEKWFTNLTEKGNTGSASIYVMLAELYASGRLNSGDRLLCYIPESGRFSSGYMLLTAV